MDKKRALLALGGALISIGGFTWWYLSRQTRPPCSTYSESECYESGYCYWYGGQCNSTPGGATPCTEGVAGYCEYEGKHICDRYNNLCRCIDPETGTWQLIEPDSPACYYRIWYNKCVNEEGTMDCRRNVGEFTDECWPDQMPMWGSASGCSCMGAECPAQDICCQDFICRMKANESLWLEETDMACSGSGGTNSCIHVFDPPIAANTISGNLYYKWGPWPFGPCGYKIYAWYKGTRTIIDESSPLLVCVGDWGNWGISKNFSSRCMDAIEFEVNAVGTNIHVDKFIGALTYIG